MRSAFAFAGLVLLLGPTACSDDPDEARNVAGRGGSAGSAEDGGRAGQGGTAGSAGTGGAAGTSGSSGQSGAGSSASGDECPTEATNARCTDPSMICAVDKGCCACTIIPTCGPDPAWTCLEPSAPAGCPAEPPAADTACTAPALKCAYCRDTTPLVRVCVGGAINQWREDSLRSCR